MSANKHWILSAAIVASTALVAPAWAADYTGTYTGFHISVELHNGMSGYTGTMIFGDKQFPLTAQDTGGGLQGSFTSDGNSFPFNAKIDGTMMSIDSGNTTYILEKKPAPQGLLTDPNAISNLGNSPQPQPNNPLAQAAQNNNAPAPAPSVQSNTMNSTPGNGTGGLTLVASRGNGRALFGRKDGISGVQPALQAAMHDLSQAFDGPVTVTGAYSDNTGMRNGIASFTARLQGQDMKGIVLVGLDQQGATVSVLYDSPNAPQAEFDALLAAVTPQKMQQFTFPDNSGTISLPDGWTTQSRSCIGGFLLTGPNDQKIMIGVTLPCDTPDGQAVQVHNQLAANAQAMGGPQPPPLNAFVAPYCEPVDVIPALASQLDQLSQNNGNGSIHLERLIDSAPATPSLPVMHAGVVYYAYTRSLNGVDTHLRVLGRVETCVTIPGSWSATLSTLEAPDSTFDADLPTMMLIAHSFNPNEQVIGQIMQATSAVINAQIACFDAAREANTQAFETFTQSAQEQEAVNDKSNESFDALISGFGTIRNTATGQDIQVSYCDAQQDVNKWNQSSPGLYKDVSVSGN